MNSLYQKYKERGLTVLGIAAGDDAEKSRRVIKQRNITYPQLLNTGNQYSEAYGIKKKNPPQIAVWLEDADRRYLGTPYASKKIATQGCVSAGGNRRKEARFLPPSGGLRGAIGEAWFMMTGFISTYLTASPVFDRRHTQRDFRCPTEGKDRTPSFSM